MKNIAIIFVRVLSLYYLVEFVTESIPQIIGITNSTVNEDWVLGV